MKNKRRLGNQDELFCVDLDFYPHYSLTDKSKRIFRSKIGQYVWVLFQDGLLVSKVNRHEKIVKYRIDFYDNETIYYFRNIPLVFGRIRVPNFVRRWKLRVRDVDVDTEYDELRMDESGNLYLSGYRKAWYDHMSTLAKLKMELKEISKQLD